MQDRRAFHDTESEANPFTKECQICGEEKDISEFAKSKQTKSGLFPCCRVCDGLYQASIKYDVSIDTVRALRAETHCNLCGHEVYNTGNSGQFSRVIHHRHDRPRGEDNVVTWCSSCNKAEGFIHSVAQAEALLRYVKEREEG